MVDLDLLPPQVGKPSSPQFATRSQPHLHVIRRRRDGLECLIELSSRLLKSVDEYGQRLGAEREDLGLAGFGGCVLRRLYAGLRPRRESADRAGVTHDVAYDVSS